MFFIRWYRYFHSVRDEMFYSTWLCLVFFACKFLQGKNSIQNDSLIFSRKTFPLTFKAWKERSQISLDFPGFP